MKHLQFQANLGRLLDLQAPIENDLLELFLLLLEHHWPAEIERTLRSLRVELTQQKVNYQLEGLGVRLREGVRVELNLVLTLVGLHVEAEHAQDRHDAAGHQFLSCILHS